MFERVNGNTPMAIEDLEVARRALCLLIRSGTGLAQEVDTVDTAFGGIAFARQIKFIIVVAPTENDRFRVVHRHDSRRQYGARQPNVSGWVLEQIGHAVGIGQDGLKMTNPYEFIPNTKIEHVQSCPVVGGSVVE